MKNKKFAALILMLSLIMCIVLYGCNNDNGEAPGSNGDDKQPGNGTQTEVPGVDIPDDKAKYEQAMELFAELAMEMDLGDRTTTRARMIELFGTPSIDDYFMLEFKVADDMGIFALIENERITQIAIQPVPDFFYNEDLNPDFNALREYQRNSEGLTLDYFNTLLGADGLISAYTSGYFSYTWWSSEFQFSVDVDKFNNVSNAYFLDLTMPQIVNGDGFYHQSFIVIPGNILKAMDELSREMEKNNGSITVDRAVNIVNHTHKINDNRMVFEFENNISIVLFLDDDSKTADGAFLWLPPNTYYNQSLPFSAEQLDDMEDKIYKMTLDEFKDLVESPGTLLQYTFDGFGHFTYVWRTPGFSVLINADSKGAILSFAVSPTDG